MPRENNWTSGGRRAAIEALGGVWRRLSGGRACAWRAGCAGLWQAHSPSNFPGLKDFCWSSRMRVPPKFKALPSGAEYLSASSSPPTRSRQKEPGRRVKGRRGCTRLRTATHGHAFVPLVPEERHQRCDKDEELGRWTGTRERWMGCFTRPSRGPAHSFALAAVLSSAQISAPSSCVVTSLQLGAGCADATRLPLCVQRLLRLLRHLVDPPELPRPPARVGGGGGEGAAAAAGGPWGEPGWQSCSHAAPERFYRISVTGRHEPWSLPLPTAESRAEAALACASHWWFATSTRPPARPPAHPPTRQTPARRPYAHPPAHAHHSASLQMYKYCTDLKLYKNWRWSKRLSSGE